MVGLTGGGAGSTSLVSFNHNTPGYTLAAQLGGNLAVNQVGSGTKPAVPRKALSHEPENTPHRYAHAG